MNWPGVCIVKQMTNEKTSLDYVIRWKEGQEVEKEEEKKEKGDGRRIRHWWFSGSLLISHVKWSSLIQSIHQSEGLTAGQGNTCVTHQHLMTPTISHSHSTELSWLTITGRDLGESQQKALHNYPVVQTQLTKMTSTDLDLTGHLD